MGQAGRLLPFGVADGATHMATDSWLLDELISGRQPPLLRFYRWQPVALSLGYHQRQWPTHWRSLTWQGQGVDVVRRPSGGRAVIHQGDLTYAIALPLAGPRQAAYRQICDALIAAWETLGVSLHYGTAGRGYHTQASCFALATGADLVTATGYKLIGSAQLRRDRYLLQHGSIRLWPDPALAAHIFGTPAESPASPPGELPPTVDEPWLAAAIAVMVDTLARSLNITFMPQPLNEQEQTEIQQRRTQWPNLANSLPGPAASAQGDIPPHP